MADVRLAVVSNLWLEMRAREYLAMARHGENRKWSDAECRKFQQQVGESLQELLDRRRAAGVEL